MKWFVLLLALAGVVFSAYATTSPPVNVSITIISSGSTPCDIGPSYIGSIPAAATQAGMIHCGANYDFSYTGTFGSSNQYQWSNLATWFSCNPQTSGAWLLAYLPYVTGVGCDTTHQNIVTDGSTQVLALTYTLNDKNAGAYNNVVASGAFIGSSIIGGTTFPNGRYSELVMKNSNPNPCSSTDCILYGTLFTAAAQFGNSPCYLEDLSEVHNTSNLNDAWDIWNANVACGSGGGGMGAALPISSPAPNSSTYTTYGHLATIDGSAFFGLCDYTAAGVVNGLTGAAFESCIPAQQVVPPTATSIFTNRQALWLWDGPESPSQGGNLFTASSDTIYIQRLTVWVCPSPTGGTWQTTGECYNNPVISTHP